MEPARETLSSTGLPDTKYCVTPTHMTQKLEHSAGYPSGLPAQMMPNPPTALLLVLPLGPLGPFSAELLWIALLLLSASVSIQLVRNLYAGQQSKLHLIAYGFAPLLSCLLAGQVGIFILLGLVLFLKWHEKRPFLAGASLWLCLLKPHLFLPFGVVLLLWIFFVRKYKILAGAVFAFLVSGALATAMNPLVWEQYWQMMRTTRVDRTPLPCLSVLLRQWVYPHTLWIQSLPFVSGCIWALVYYYKRRHVWDWATHGSVLMLVSVLVAPYTWFMDQVILIPAILAGAYSTNSRAWIAVLALMSAAIEIESMRWTVLVSPFYLWTAPAWLIWYLVAIKYRPVPEPGKDEPIGLNV